MWCFSCYGSPKAMEANALPKSSPLILLLTKPWTKTHLHSFPPAQPRRFPTLISSSSSSSNTSGNDGETPPPVPPPDNVQIKFRRGSRRRSRQLQDGVSDGLPKKAQVSAPKNWEEMSITEKAIELYVGEKGLLFWLNKFAYASIFIIIGAWILFRFVGPSLNLYQLDSAPLSPSNLLKGS